MLTSVLVVIASILTLLIFTPIGWMKVVWALWNFAFGATILALQFNQCTAKLDKYAGFLSTRVGRSLFYLYCGNAGGASAAYADAPWYLVLLSYGTFMALWYVGLLELCGPRRPASLDADLSRPLPAEVPTVAPLGASTGAAPGSISVSITPDQAMSAAKFVGNNKAASKAAWQAAVATGGSSGSASDGRDSKAPNPFFGT